MSFGFLAYPIRLLSFNDVKDTCPVKGVTLTVLNMLYLRKSERDVRIGHVNLGVTEEETTKAIDMDKIT